MNSSMSLSTKRSRDPSPVRIEINLLDSDDECDLVIDVSAEQVIKKPRMRRNCRNWHRGEVVCAEELHGSALADSHECTEEMLQKSTVLCKNSRSLRMFEKQGVASPKANGVYLSDVNRDILEGRDAHSYTEKKQVSSAASVEAGVQKKILKQSSAETSVLPEALVEEHANEDTLSSRRLTRFDVCTGHTSKYESTIETPYKEIIITEEKQRIKESGGNDSSKDWYSHPNYFLHEKKCEITLPSSSESEISGEESSSNSDDPLEECQRIFDEYEREAQKKAHNEQDREGNVDVSLLGSQVNIPRQKRRITRVAKSDVLCKDEMMSFKASPWQHASNVKNQQLGSEVSAAVQTGQTCTATTSEQEKTTFRSVALPFQSIEQIQIVPSAQLNEANTGQLPVLPKRNVATAKPRRVTGTSFKPTTLEPWKVSTLESYSMPKSGWKVPLEIRQRYFNVFLPECLKICDTVNEAFQKALAEEQSVYDRCGGKKMYLNFAVKTLKKLRDYGQSSKVASASGTGPVRSEEETGADLYEFLKTYCLTEEQLNENNFPRPNPEKVGSALLPGVMKNAGYDVFKRLCCRCGKVYTVNSSGEHESKEECNYHSGQILEQTVPGGVEKCYSCCERIVGSDGCQTAKLHVHDGRGKTLEGFVKTITKSPPNDGSHGIYALDCEMCYTTHGLEVTRVTVVDAELHVVYDTFVKAEGKVIDYDLRLSRERLEDTKRKNASSFWNVQAVLLNLFNADTILIGHCLEKCLLVLKLIHYTVVDTSVVFPHQLGLPNKRTLGSLTAEYLRKIHEDDGNAHSEQNFMAFDIQWSSWMLHLKACNILCSDSANM